VAFLSFVLMPAVFALVYLVLPLCMAREIELLMVAVAFAVLAVLLPQLDLNALAHFSEHFPTHRDGFWSLNFYQALS